MDEPERLGQIPGAHEGYRYEDFLEMLSKRRGTRRYLEVGVRDGQLLSRIHADVAVGVDPEFVITRNIAANKGRVSLVTATSDRFFATAESVGLLAGEPDLVFLDGYHTYEFLLRDFINAEAICHERSLIVLHDCLPLDTIMTIRYLQDWRGQTAGTRFDGWWTGDVWKIVPILQRYRPDLEIVYTDCHPTGLVCISNLSPGNRTLDENYFDILKGFGNSPSTELELRRLYSMIEITPSRDILKEFDHSHFFRT